MNIDEICARIKYFLDFNHWTLYKLAAESDLPYSSIRNIFSRKTYPTIVTLEKICNGLGITMSEFFDTEKNNPLRNNELTAEEQELLNRYKRLSKYHKDLLDAYLKGLSNN